MHIVLKDRHGREKILVADRTIATMPDRDVVDSMINAERLIAAHLEFDCGDGEGCPACNGARETLDALDAEEQRRTREGISIEDRDAPSFEERHAPFGLEWELEQRDRMEGLA